MTDDRIEGVERQKMIEEGLRLGHEGADRAASVMGALWKAKALIAFISYAKSHKRFTAEDVRLAHPEIVGDGDLRAWGSVAKAAKQCGAVEPHGFARSISRKVHGSINTLWESLICEAAQ